MEDCSLKIDIMNFISYSDDLVAVLKDKKDINNLMQTLEGDKILRSSCETDLSDVQKLLESYEKNINACKRKIDEAKNDVVADEDLDSLQKELEEQLQRECLLREEFRIVRDEISSLEHQGASVEERKRIVNKSQNDEFKAQRMLSMYASVTNIIPNLGYKTKISGHIVERDKKMVEMFEFESENASSTEFCNNLWKMINL